jgi:hypothetical protein
MVSKKALKLVADTWAEIGRKARPLRRMVFVRSEVFNNKTASGLLYLPGKIHGFYGGLPHMRTLYGTILAAGPDATVMVGERVAFTRLYFAIWLPLMEEGAFVGWINENDMIGYADLDPLPEVANEPVKRARVPASKHR